MGRVSEVHSMYQLGLIIRTVVPQCNNSIYAIQDPSHYYFAKNNDRFIQSDDLNEDFEGALLNLYEYVVIGLKNTI